MELTNLQKLPAPLLAWYDENRRVLPWRERVSPYRTWVSEIMLQQTRVQAVLPYFQRFMEAAPDVAALAALPEERLLRLWQGLGYYSRARNLKRAAQTVMEDCGGVFPDSYEGLRKLAGIGDYTAGAILSIAFGQAVPAVDGNVLRVAARLTGDGGNVLEPKVRAAYRQAMADIIPYDRPGDFNQALRDLGAAVCLPGGKPMCGQCPAAGFCTARQQGTQCLLPVREKKKEKREVHLTVFVMEREDGAAALRQRPDTGLLAGLWEYPHAEGTLDEAAAAAQLAAWGVTALQWRRTLHAKHAFTHLRWQMTGYLLTVAGAGQPDWLWAGAAARRQRAIPSAFQAFTAALEDAPQESNERKGD